MVYMLAAAELFKDRNVISLFDEPDAFLHPEWQFEFLNQIDAISAQAADPLAGFARCIRIAAEPTEESLLALLPPA